MGPFIFDWTKLAAGILSLIAFAVVYYFLHKTKTGKALQATSLNKEAASYMGIRTDRMNAIAWAIGGGTVGMAGGLLVNFYYAYPMVGILFVMIAFACVALGGFGSIKGVFFAGLLVGILEMIFLCSDISSALIFSAPTSSSPLCTSRTLSSWSSGPRDCSDGKTERRP